MNCVLHRFRHFFSHIRWKFTYPCISLVSPDLWILMCFTQEHCNIKKKKKPKDPVRFEPGAFMLRDKPFNNESWVFFFFIGPHIRREYWCSSQEAESREISISCKNLFLNRCKINMFLLNSFNKILSQQLTYDRFYISSKDLKSNFDHSCNKRY